MAQKTGTNVITYTRGADGALISMNRNGTIYYYQTNLQGDVEKILDGSGTTVVSYTYDAYGRITSTSGSMKDTLGVENPFRYRSYFFDQESGFYYLQSRYYDPMMGRFISADSQINPDVNGGNVFAYCSNNPVNHSDPNGHKGKSILSRIFSTAYKIAITAIAIYSVLSNPTLLILPIMRSVVLSDERKRVIQKRAEMTDPLRDVTTEFIDKLDSNVAKMQNEGFVDRYLMFYNNVKSGHDWDYKQDKFYGRDNTYVFNEYLETGEDLGNISFGYMGASLGLPEEVLLIGAGLYQIKQGTTTLKSLIASNGDDLRDQDAISKGYSLYMNRH